jgi:hypothetical protein
METNSGVKPWRLSKSLTPCAAPPFVLPWAEDPACLGGWEGLKCLNAGPFPRVSGGFATNTEAPVKQDQNVHQGLFSKGKMSHSVTGSLQSRYIQIRALPQAERYEGQAVRQLSETERQEVRLVAGVPVNDHWSSAHLARPSLLPSPLHSLPASEAPSGLPSPPPPRKRMWLRTKRETPLATIP